MLSTEIITGILIRRAMKMGSPKPTSISKMFDPNTLEEASEISPFLALQADTTKSGKLVAAAIIVKLIIMGGIPRKWEREIACLTKK